jgi:hypothetical protein
MKKAVWIFLLVTQVAALALGFRFRSLALELGGAAGILMCWRGVTR